MKICLSAATAVLVSTCALSAGLFAAEKPAASPKQQAVIKQFDKDGDGKLNAEEMRAARQAKGNAPAEGQGAAEGKPGQMQPNFAEIVRRFDRNGNGRLEGEEMQAAQRAFMDGRGQGGEGKPGVRQGGEGAGNKGGEGRPGQRPGGGLENLPPQVMQEALRLFDANRNGRLDPPEMQMVQQALAARAAAGGEGGAKPRAEK